MKKFISLFTVAIMALVAMVAEAKTVTVTINDPEGATVIDTSITYLPITFTDGTATVELGSTGGLQVSTNRGYDITSITVNETPLEGNFISTDQMPDGCTVAIVVEKPQDKSVTITVDNPDALNIINTFDGSPVSFSENNLSQSVTISGTSPLQINTTSGYLIETITVNGKIFPHDSSSNVSISASAVPDNCTINITTKEKVQFSYYIEGNPAQISVIANYDYSNRLTSTNAVDGRWTVITYEPSQTLTIEAENGYVITSVQRVVTDGDNIELLTDNDKNKSYANINLTNVSAGTTIKIESTALTELRTAHVSIVLKNGTASQIQVRRGSDTIEEADFNDIAIIPGGVENIVIQSTNYKPLYKITVGERTVEATDAYGEYYVTNLENGDVINVWPDFPDEDVAVNISFTNEGTNSALTLSVNGSTVTEAEWSVPNYSVPSGTSLGFTFDTTNYTINSVTVNGTDMPSYGFQYVVSDETTVVINATKKKGYDVTVIYTPGAVKIYNGNSINDELVTLEDGADEKTFEVNTSTSSILIEPEEGYIITQIENVDTDEVYPSGSIYINQDNMTILVTTEKFERNQTAVIYLQADKQWEGAEIVLSANNHSMMTDQTLKKGYNIVEYAPQDRPFGFKVLPVPEVYLNGEKIANNGGGIYESTASFEPGDVIKIFEADYTVENYSLTINKAEGVNVNILADYVTPVDGSSATVFGPTDVEFVAASRAAVLPFIVKVNGTEVVPTEEGKVIATITSDSTIAVEANPATSITEINAEDTDSATYNLQGVRVSNPKKGIFIKNGKKVIL